MWLKTFDTGAAATSTAAWEKVEFGGQTRPGSSPVPQIAKVYVSSDNSGGAGTLGYAWIRRSQESAGQVVHYGTGTYAIAAAAGRTDADQAGGEYLCDITLENSKNEIDLMPCQHGCDLYIGVHTNGTGTSITVNVAWATEV